MHVKTEGVFVGRDEVDFVSDFPIIHNKTAVSMTGVQAHKVVRLLTRHMSMSAILASGL